MLTETQVAAVYGIGLRQLRAMRTRGNGPRFLKVSGRIGEPGGRIVYDRRDVEEWLARCPQGGEVTAAAR